MSTPSELHFESDYTRSGHPAILEAMAQHAQEFSSGYGIDPISESARQLIREAIGNPHADIQFVVGGTQANQVVISSILRPFEGVIATTTAHIATHEAGAIEASGHKVITVGHTQGKLDPAVLRRELDAWNNDDNREHIVHPGMVYITHPTEFGSVYTRDELKQLHEICVQAQIPLFIDGARLAYGLAAAGTDVSLTDLAQYADVFTIGGTKCGALFGEAIVARSTELIPSWFSQIKLRGALLAKGWLLGLQFNTLFTDNLYLRLGEHADTLAMRIRTALAERGYELYVDSPTNQQFVTIPQATLQRLSQHMPVAVWEYVGEDHEQALVRFCTSWYTTEEEVDQLIALL